MTRHREEILYLVGAVCIEQCLLRNCSVKGTVTDLTSMMQMIGPLDGDELKITGENGAIIQFIDLKFIWCYSEFAVCEANSHVNNLKEWKSQSAPTGWTFNKATRGPWDKEWTNRVSFNGLQVNFSMQIIR